MRDRLIMPTCASCENSYYHDERTGKILKGVRVQPFEHYCLGCKRPKMFRKKDPKTKVPDWCPKRKVPCELRIYGFTSADNWHLHEQLCNSLCKEISPSAHRYEVRYQGIIEIQPYEFWKRCEDEVDSNLLPVTVTLHEVVEIDDGLKPAFFYKTKSGYKIAYAFKPTQQKA